MYTYSFKRMYLENFKRSSWISRRGRQQDLVGEPTYIMTNIRFWGVSCFGFTTEFWIYQDFFQTPLDTPVHLLWMPLPLRVLVWTWIHRRKNTATFCKWPRKQATLRPCYVQWILYLVSIYNGGSKGARGIPPGAQFHAVLGKIWQNRVLAPPPSPSPPPSPHRLITVWSPVSHHNHYTKEPTEPTVSGRHETQKSFHWVSWLTDSSFIQLIHLI